MYQIVCVVLEPTTAIVGLLPWPKRGRKCPLEMHMGNKQRQQAWSIVLLDSTTFTCNDSNRKKLPSLGQLPALHLVLN